MREFSVSDVMSQGWDLVKKYGLLLAVMYFVFDMIIEGLGQIFGPSIDYQYIIDSIKNHDMLSLIKYNTKNHIGMDYSGIIHGLIQTLFEAGFISTILMLTKGVMTSVSFDGFKMPAIVYLKYFAVDLICGIIFFVGCLFCLIPGIFFAVKLTFATRYILDHHEAGIGEALSASWEMTNGNFWNVFVLGLANFGFIILGFLCCCIGVYFAIPLIEFNVTTAYYALRGVNTQTTQDYV